jgi:AGCS family alanine or glycine:cation symporter
MDGLKDYFMWMNELFTLGIIFPVMIALGCVLTWKLRFLQFTQLGSSFKLLMAHRNTQEGTISHFEAISAVLAGNLGTGNISGIAVALTTGGPGALVWMWVMACLGSIIQYASCVLGALYSQKNDSGEVVGGPMYYLSQGLNWGWGAVLFCVFTIIAAVTCGNFAQINSVILPLKELAIDPLLGSIAIGVLVAVVLLGGMQRFARVASAVVPFMALIYLGTALLILVLQADKIVPAFKTLLLAAFSSEALAGGTAGFAVLKAISVGFGRGIFATDAGTGMAPILQSSAKDTHPAINGLVALVAPFLVMIVCTLTGLVLITTGAWQTGGLQSTNICTYAFTSGLGSQAGFYIVMLSLFLFAYTTILAWACCGARAVEYLWGKKAVKWFYGLYVALVPIGALMQVELIWVVADMAIGAMMITNLVGVCGLINRVAESRELYLQFCPEYGR